VDSNRSNSIVGIFILITVMFVIFFIFAFYTVASLKSSNEMADALSNKKAQILVVEVDGVIMDSKNTIKKLLKAEKHKETKAIILRINSPGGAVGPTQEIFEEVVRIDKKIPVYASFGTVAASGGYYLGAACRKIFSPAGAMTGSIGVIMNFFNLKELMDWAKVKPQIIKAGKYKDIGSQSRDMTVEERALLVGMTENVHQQFINDIFKRRGSAIKGGLEGLEQYAQGQIFSGEEALNRGLVDEIAGLWQAGRSIHKELELKDEFDLKFVKLEKKMKFAELVRSIDGLLGKISSLFSTSAMGPMYLLDK